jgi:hypothetical protein
VTLNNRPRPVSLPRKHRGDSPSCRLSPSSPLAPAMVAASPAAKGGGGTLSVDWGRWRLTDAAGEQRTELAAS